MYSLEVRGDVVVLDFGMRNSGDRSFGVGSLFGKGRETDDVSGVYLHDVARRTKYFPATAGGECVCSTGLDGFAVPPGGVQYLSATFGKLPGDVEETDVHVPSVGTFEKVPIEQ